MSRTFRRLERHNIQRWVGRPDDFSSWRIERLYPTLSRQQLYIRAVRRYTSDAGSHGYPCGIPYWFRRIHGSKAMRLGNREEIFRCLTNESWDDHKPLNLRHIAGCWWW